MTTRSQHWLDEPQARGRKRTIKNWMHYRAPQAESKLVADDFDPWIETRPRAKPPNGVIPKWTGNIDMAFASLDAPLQAFAGDTTDAKNSALWGVRCADRPDSWANWKAYGVKEGVAPKIEEDEAGNVIGATWPGLWPGADLEIRHEGHKASKTIVVRERSAPTHYEFTLKMAGGHEAVESGGGLSIRDAQGVERMAVRAPWARDSATTGIGPDGAQYFAATLKRMADVTIKGGGKVACYAIDIDPRDLASAVLPLYIDPTTTISGTAAIEDTQLRADAASNLNFGGRVNMYCSLNLWIPLIRVTQASLPDGSYTAARLKAYCEEHSGGGAKTPTAYQVSSANTWVEGSKDYAVEVGACSWGHAKHDTQAWAGSAGCQTANVDYITTGSTTISVTGTGAFTATLPTAWFAAWKSGAVVANGFMLDDGVYYFAISSTESATPARRPYFEIDYSTASPHAASMLARRIAE